MYVSMSVAMFERTAIGPQVGVMRVYREPLGSIDEFVSLEMSRSEASHAVKELVASTFTSMRTSAIFSPSLH